MRRPSTAIRIARQQPEAQSGSVTSSRSHSWSAAEVALNLGLSGGQAPSALSHQPLGPGATLGTFLVMFFHPQDYFYLLSADPGLGLEAEVKQPDSHPPMGETDKTQEPRERGLARGWGRGEAGMAPPPSCTRASGLAESTGLGPCPAVTLLSWATSDKLLLLCFSVPHLGNGANSSSLLARLSRE